MALSMFLCKPVCTSRVLGLQLMKLSTQSILKPGLLRPTATVIPFKSTLLTAETTPIQNSVCSFRTSSVRLSQEKGHDHSKLWVIEKATAALLVPLIPLGLMMPNKLIDTVLAVLITAHSFWGLEAIAADYIRPAVLGPVLPKVAIVFVYLISIATLAGLLYIITHDIGLCNTVRQFWAIKHEQRA